LGELQGHYIKRLERRVGVTQTDHQAGVEDSVADILISLCVFCAREHLDLDTLTRKVWREVSKRTFVFTEEGLKHLGK